MHSMNAKQVHRSVATLQSLLQAGRTLSDAVAMLAKRDAKNADFWRDAVTKVRTGRPLSEILHGVWPAEGVAAIRAGEASGKLAAVLDEYYESLLLQDRLVKSARRIFYPAGIVAGAVVVFLGMFLTVVPIIGESLQHMAGGAQEAPALTRMAIEAQTWILDNWVIVLMSVGAAASLVVSWLRMPATKEDLVKLVLGLPVVGPALTLMAFGLWARFAAMSIAAGIPAAAALRSTASILPFPLRSGVLLLADDLSVRHRSMTDAINLAKLPQSDPRQTWPDDVLIAFTNGDMTGQLDKELNRVAPVMLRDGERVFDKAIELATNASMFGAAILVGSNLLIVYLPMLSGLKNLR
ncbi:type II secretion system F family protein [Stenotrophomonas maltophilia]